MSRQLPLIPPGEILLEEFLRPLGVSQHKLARDLDVPVARVNDIIKGRRGISADTALRLAAYFETTAEFWLNLQSRFDLKTATAKIGDKVLASVRPFKAAA